MDEKVYHVQCNKKYGAVTSAIFNLENGEQGDTQSTHAGWFEFDLKSNEREN